MLLNNITLVIVLSGNSLGVLYLTYLRLVPTLLKTTPFVPYFEIFDFEQLHVWGLLEEFGEKVVAKLVQVSDLLPATSLSFFLGNLLSAW